MYWNRIIGRSNVGSARVSILAPFGELGGRWSAAGRSTAPLHSRSVRCDELNFQSFTQTFSSTTKLQHIRVEGMASSFLSDCWSGEKFRDQTYPRFARYLKGQGVDPENPKCVVVAVFF